MLMSAARSILYFRLTALTEAISYLLLLGVAMPLKYVWGQPLAVKIIGSIHGGLFVLFCLTLAFAMQAGQWSLKRAVGLFFSSLVPFLPFWLDAHLRTWQAEAGSKFAAKPPL
jgi:integral membrane protein